MCDPAVIGGMVKLAVDGDPEATFASPRLTPSIVKLTEPVGCVEPGVVAVIDAVTTREVPAVGVSVAGTSTSVVGLLPTVMETLVDTELL